MQDGSNIAGLDLHRRFSQVCVMSRDGEEMLNRSFKHTLEGLIQMSEALEGCERVAMEACWGWEAMSDFLDGVLGKEVHLAHMLKVKLIAEARIKTDTIDARTLAQLERVDFLPLAHRPSRDVREVRALLRQRMFFVGIRTSLKNTVHAVLGKHGMIFEGSDQFGVSGRRWLEERLPLFTEGYRRVLERTLRGITVLNELMKEIEGEIGRKAQEDEIVRLLQTIPGIGLWTAMVIRYEVDGVERFSHPKKLVSYSGICARVHGTGGPAKYKYGGMTKQGNRYLRTALVEGAFPAIRAYAPWRKVYERIKAQRGANVAKGAVAHRMLEAVYWVWKKKERFAPRLTLDDVLDQEKTSTLNPVGRLASSKAV